VYPFHLTQQRVMGETLHASVELPFLLGHKLEKIRLGVP